MPRDESPRLAAGVAASIVYEVIAQQVGILATSSCTGYDVPEVTTTTSFVPAA